MVIVDFIFVVGVFCWCSFRFVYCYPQRLPKMVPRAKPEPPRKKGKQATGVTKNAGKMNYAMETTGTIKKWGQAAHYEKKERKRSDPCDTNDERQREQRQAVARRKRGHRTRQSERVMQNHREKDHFRCKSLILGNVVFAL